MTVIRAAGRGLRWLAVSVAVTLTVALVLLLWWATDRTLWPWLAGATGCLAVSLGGIMDLRRRRDPSTAVEEPVERIEPRAELPSETLQLPEDQS